MKRRTALIFYVLSAYVVIQFIWWGYHLVELTREVSSESSSVGRRVTMVMGEGAVFLIIVLVGVWQIHRSIRRDLKLSERQHNFMLSVTHELKTPLAANKLYIQTIAKRDLTKEQRDQILARAIEENDRLERMIDNILNASRLESKGLILSKETLDLRQLVNTIVDRFKPLAPNVNFSLEFPDELSIVADRMMMDVVLSNLIENAIKYAGKDANIQIYGSSTALGVKDSGPGVAEEDRHEIFKKFYRAGSEDTRSEKGSGLGLYIVRELVRLHGWSIHYLPAEPTGSNFKIDLTNDN